MFKVFDALPPLFEVKIGGCHGAVLVSLDVKS